MALQINTGRGKTVTVQHPDHWGDIHTAGDMLWDAGYSMRQFEEETAHMTGIDRAIADKVMKELEWRAEDESE